MTGRDEVLSAARSALAGGDPELAAGKLRGLLSTAPEDVDARFYFARSLAALGRLEDAIAEFSRIVAAHPKHPRALVQLGIAHASRGDHPSALEVLEHAKKINPDAAELHFALGLSQLGTGDPTAAVSSFRKAIALNLRVPDVYNNLGAAQFQLAQIHDAIESFRQAIRLAPNFITAKRNLGDALSKSGDTAGAIEAYRDAAALAPGDPNVHVDLGLALIAAKEFLTAAESLARALSLDGGLIDVAALQGDAFRLANRHDEAARAYGRAIGANPQHAEALLGLGLLAAAGNDPHAAGYLVRAWQAKPADPRIALATAEALDRLGQRSQALEICDQAARSLPTNADIHEVHGLLLHRLGRLKEALTCYDRGLAIDPQRRSMRLNRAHALESSASVPEAMAEFRQVLTTVPGDRSALAGQASCALRLCEWGLADDAVSQLLESADGLDAVHPFLRLALDVDPGALAASFRREADSISARVHEQAIPAHAHDRLRIAYVSPDYRRHPVAYALAGLVAAHDRDRIESIGVSLTASDGSDIAIRLQSSFEHFLDCSTLSDEAIIRLLRDREIDIAVDLAGFTAGSRPALFASRIAPVQLNFLGFPCSMGARFMDAIVADAIVIPPGEEPLYAEQVQRLPHSYLPFDGARPAGVRPDSRVSCGLPERGFVFCVFTNGYKITREVFGVWMTLLSKVEGSVLWLRRGPAAMEQNLVRCAKDSGIGAERLVFAPFVERMDEHFARLQLADLFLDTLPYNAHTTTTEALWAGVPVVTCRGRTFAGRVGASLLTAAGLSDLVTESLDSYKELALSLATSASQLAEMRERVRASRSAAPVFDTARYVRDFEALLNRLWRRR